MCLTTEDKKMHASTLIENLRALISEHGDLEVYLIDWSEDYYPPAEVGFVEYSVCRRYKRFIMGI